MGAVFQPLQGQAIGCGSEAVAERAQPQHHVDPTLVTRTVGQHRGQLLDRATGDRGVRVGDLPFQLRCDHLLVDQCGVGVWSQTLDDQRQPGEDFALVGPALGQWQNSRGVPGVIAH